MRQRPPTIPNAALAILVAWIVTPATPGLPVSVEAAGAAAPTAAVSASTAHAGQLVGEARRLEGVVRDVQLRLEEIRDLRARFVQRREMPGGRVIEQSGRLFVRTPGRMRWEYVEPEPRLFVATGDALYWYVPADEQVQVMEPEALQASRTPILFLSGEGDLLEEFEVYPGRWDEPLRPGNVQVQLYPRRETADFESLILEIRPETALVERLVKVEYLGSPIEYRFEDIEVDVGLSPELFEFTIPPGADLVELS